MQLPIGVADRVAIGAKPFQMNMQNMVSEWCEAV